MANELATRAPQESGLASGRPETPNEMLLRVSREEGIPPTGLTILGGRPYVNVTGLDVKLRSKCEAENLVHVGTEYVPIQEASKENGMRAAGWGVVRLFDKKGFEKSLAAAAGAGPVSKDIIDTLKELYYHIFRMRGFASPETLKMGTMQLKDNIEHMAERRATNRAKREATGTGLTSLEELPDEVASNGKPSSVSVLNPQISPPPTDLPNPWIGKVVSVEGREFSYKTGERAGKKGTVYRVTCADGVYFGTFNADAADVARSCSKTGEEVNVQWKSGKYGPEIERLDLAALAEGAEGNEA